jgi:hypothetical protein
VTNLARRAGPWLLAAALLAVLVLRADEVEIARAFARADWMRFTLAALPFAFVWLFVDTAALTRLVTRFHAPIGFGTVARLRGATYLFLALSFHAAQAALAIALHRRLRVPLLALGGTFLFYYAIDLVAIAGLGGLGAAALPGALGAALRVGLGAMFALLCAGLLVLARLARNRPDARRGVALLDTLRRARLRDAAELLGYRLLFYASFIGFAAATMPAFGMRVPWRALLVSVPMVQSIAALPLTVSGIGSTQVAMLVLYAPFADEVTVLAYSLAHSASLLALRLPIGLVCWPSIANAGPGESPTTSLAARRMSP